jgi:hypothetical protein
MIVVINLRSLRLQQPLNCLFARNVKRQTPRNYPASPVWAVWPGKVGQINFKRHPVPRAVVEESNIHLSLRYSKRNLMESFSFIIFIVIWFVLQKWILPKLGVQT